MQKTVIKLVINGTIPSKKNNKIAAVNKAGQAYMTTGFNYKKWLKNVGHPKFKELLEHCKQKYPHIEFPLQRTVKMHVLMYFGDAKARDVTNKLETIQDMLKDREHQFVQDDSYFWLNPAGGEGKYKKGVTRTEIYLSGYL